MRVLVTGWFSFEHGEATAGDLLSMRVATGWLESAGLAYDVAYSTVLGGATTLADADPSDYSDVVFVCGPAHGQQVEDLRARFEDCRFTLLDVSVAAVTDGRPDAVFERDSDRLVRPDIAIASHSAPAPFVPVIRGHAQPEYGQADQHEEAHRVIGALLERRRLATVAVDTRIDPEAVEAREPAQVEGVIAHADAVVTSRLHGLVLALKYGVPALAIDPVQGGGKVTAQARALDWPEVLRLDEASPEAVDEALARCLEPSAREVAARCRDQATERVEAVGREFVASLAASRANSPT